MLGAGFSKPLGGPLLRELLKKPYLESSQARIDELNKMIATLEEHQINESSYSLEDLFTDIWRDARTGDEDAERALRELTIHLTSVCAGLRPKMKRRNFAQYVEFFNHLHDNFSRVSIVSFNYDLVLEAILDHAGLLYNYGESRGLYFNDETHRRKLNRRVPDIQIMKLHGSANWGVCNGCKKAERSSNLIVAYDNAYVPWRRRSCPKCKERFLESGIIPPVFGKAGETRIALDAWRQARKQIRYAHHVLVVGYSLPASDREAFSLLQGSKQSKNRVKVDIVCGKRGGSPDYATAFSAFSDMECTFEDYLERVLQG